MKIESKEKDMLISQLKAHIFELKQHEKDYDQLNQKFCQIQNDCSLLQDAKMRLEYEQRQKDESYSKQLCDLRAENENLQLEFNDKLAVNKRLFMENESLMNQLEMKNNEIMDLNDQINDLLNQLKKGESDNCNLERTIQGLNDIKESQKNEISKFIEDNRTLSKVIQDQDRSIKISEQDRLALTSKLDKANYELQTLSGKLQSTEDSFYHTKTQLDNMNNVTLQLKGKLSDYERQFENQKKDIEALKLSLSKERSIREEEEKNNGQLERLLNQKERDIARFNEEIEHTKIANRRMTDDKMRMQIENDQLGKHIMILTQQNQKLIEEIENIMDQDEKMKQSLNRKDRIVALLRNNTTTLESSLNNLDNYLNRSSSMNTGAKSPNYTYDMSSSPKNGIKK